MLASESAISDAGRTLQRRYAGAVALLRARFS